MSKSANYPKILPVFYQNFKAGGKIDPRISVIRSTNLPYYGPEGNLVVAGANCPRIEYHPTTKECLGLLVEGWKANMLLNSAVAVTQTVAITAGQHYAITWEGTGTVAVAGTLSSVYTGKTFDGRNMYLFRAEETSVSIVPTGDVRKWQMEEHTAGTRYLETAGSSVTAYGDLVRLDISSVLPLRSSFTVVGQVRIARVPRSIHNRTYFQLRYNEVDKPYIQAYGDRTSIGSTAISPTDFFYASASEAMFSGGTGNKGIDLNTRIPIRVGFSVSYENDSIICACNGVQVNGNIKSLTADFQGFNLLAIGSGSIANTRPGLNGHVEEVSMYNRAVTLAELIQLTK